MRFKLKAEVSQSYWLDLLHETHYLDDCMFESINTDCAELIKLLTSIIKKLKE